MLLLCATLLPAGKPRTHARSLARSPVNARSGYYYSVHLIEVAMHEVVPCTHAHMEID